MESKTLTLRWQRLLSDGATCPRCAKTERAVETAVATLTQALVPLGIAVVFDKAELSDAQFKQAPLQSNAILLSGRPLEAWLGASSGQSPCCDVCGPNDCRTVTVGRTIYEAVPAGLIIKAGLLAAVELLGDET